MHGSSLGNAAPGDHAALCHVQRRWEQRASYCSAARAQRAMLAVTKRSERTGGRTAATGWGCGEMGSIGVGARPTPGAKDRVFLAVPGSKLVSMSRPFLNTLFSVALLAGAAVLLVQHPINLQAQQRTMRLILKDGSYQSVVKYE